MKQICATANFNYRLTLFLSCFFLFSACRKDDVIVLNSLNNSTVTNASTSKKYGDINIITSILPPVTQKCFIANGDSSIADFEVTASKLVLLRRIDFAAPSTVSYTRINSIYNYKIYNDTGVMTYYIDRYLKPGTGSDLLMNIFYNAVNKNNSGAIAQISVTHISYVTIADNVVHDIYPDQPVQTQPMCLVYNKPVITFQNPTGALMTNGWKEIIEMKLAGDSAWTLNALPVFINAGGGYNGSIPKCVLVVKNEKKKLSTKSDSISVCASGSAGTVINFPDGFQHQPGKKEILKIFAPVKGTSVSFISTMNPYSSFVWKDALNTKFNGNSCDKFFKDDTYFSSYYYQQ